MKNLTCVFIVYLAGFHSIRAQDSIPESRKGYRINIEVGQGAGFFIDKPNTFGIRSATFISGPNFGKISLITPMEWVYSINYKNNFYSYKSNGVFANGEFHVLDISVGLNFQILNKKTFFQPDFSISNRFLAKENVIQETPFFAGYGQQLSSLKYGVGIGLSLYSFVYKRFTVGVESQYNHYFGNTKATVKDPNIKNYHVNRGVVNIALNAGLQIGR